MKVIKHNYVTYPAAASPWHIRLIDRWLFQIVGTTPDRSRRLCPSTLTGLEKHLFSKCSEQIAKRSCGIKLLRWVFTNLTHCLRIFALLTGQAWIEIPALRFAVLLHPWTTHLLGGIVILLGFYLCLKSNDNSFKFCEARFKISWLLLKHTARNSGVLSVWRHIL